MRIKPYDTFQPTVRVFTTTSEPAQHPSAVVNVPHGWKIVGGGAHAHWSTSGTLLVESYPLDSGAWRVLAKDHMTPEYSTITAYALAFHDPEDRFDVQIFTQTSSIEAHPAASVQVAEDYIMTGGGARVIDGSRGRAGNMLTSSFPSSSTSWSASSKDHMHSDPRKLQVYAIGIRDKRNEVFFQNRIITNSGDRAQHPCATVQMEGHGVMTGGGALVHYEEPGNILTASYPSESGWEAKSKDHELVSRAHITAYAVLLI
ncbi:hypothetical protein PROFUN_05116 [Planoprotostelium fungivorum]|uniref:Uncharacterized protein n=1 Tax=Planoprotostelium fungivorum TaxID=1890364 RepID=A0A2P6NRQ7_9EUKA|nr:hypothetical protein PROFUN_05116 [Planoprotostelium fungivorum]